MDAIRWEYLFLEKVLPDLQPKHTSLHSKVTWITFLSIWPTMRSTNNLKTLRQIKMMKTMVLDIKEVCLVYWNILKTQYLDRRLKEFGNRLKKLLLKHWYLLSLNFNIRLDPFNRMTLKTACVLKSLVSIFSLMRNLNHSWLRSTVWHLLRPIVHLTKRSSTI